MKSKVPDLPRSQDEDFWGDGERIQSSPVPLQICKTHTKETWMSPENKYIDNHDGTISCEFCAWGTPLPGFLRFINGKVVDLRSVSEDKS